MLINLLFHKFPIVQKSTADAFYMYTMTHGEDEFGEDVADELQDILIDQDWLDMSEKDKVDVKASLEKVLGDKLPAEVEKKMVVEEKQEEKKDDQEEEDDEEI